MVMILPIYETEQEGVYYNTAAVIDADGTYLGKTRKVHIPYIFPAFWEKFYFAPGTIPFPVFETAYAKIGIYICYDRHFPECARTLALKGAHGIAHSQPDDGKSSVTAALRESQKKLFDGIFPLTL
jgi:N-carbamoylputrescine amidase